MTTIKKTFQAAICSFFTVICFASCATLSQSQLKEVNAFGTLTKDFSAAPGKIFSTINDAHLQQELLLSNAIHKPDDHLASINDVYDDQQKKSALNQQADAAMQVLNDYGQKLAHLAADVHSKQLDTAALALGTDLDKLISSYNALVPAHAVPTGIGAFFGQLVASAGDIYVRARQADGVKLFVTKGDVLISHIGLAIKDNLDGDGMAHPSLKDLISSEKDDLKKNYSRYLKRDKEELKIYGVDKKTKKADTTVVAYSAVLDAWRAGAFDADNLYLKSLAGLDAAEQLRVQCLAAADNLIQAHHQLLKDLQERKKIKDLYATLQDYASAVNQLYATYKKIK